jgi:hypothetical protein
MRLLVRTTFRTQVEPDLEHVVRRLIDGGEPRRFAQLPRHLAPRQRSATEEAQGRGAGTARGSGTLRCAARVARTTATISVSYSVVLLGQRVRSARLGSLTVSRLRFGLFNPPPHRAGCETNGRQSRTCTSLQGTRAAENCGQLLALPKGRCGCPRPSADSVECGVWSTERVRVPSSPRAASGALPGRNKSSPAGVLLPRGPLRRWE